MTQSRRHSLLETCCNTAIGYVVAVATQAVVFPWFGIRITTGQDAVMAAIFTVVSLVRGYCVRRVWNSIEEHRIGNVFGDCACWRCR